MLIKALEQVLHRLPELIHRSDHLNQFILPLVDLDLLLLEL